MDKNQAKGKMKDIGGRIKIKDAMKPKTQEGRLNRGGGACHSAALLADY